MQSKESGIRTREYKTDIFPFVSCKQGLHENVEFKLENAYRIPEGNKPDLPTNVGQ